MLYGLLKIIAIPVFKVLFNLTAYGRKNLPKNTGKIVASNHKSALDIPSIGVALPGRMYMMAKKELFQRKIEGWIFRAFGAIKVDREAISLETVRKAREVVEKGHSLLIFPEGTRVQGADIGEGKKGAVFLSCSAHVPIIPTGVSDTFYLSKHRVLGLFPHVVVVFGEPFYPWLVFNSGDKDFLEKATVYLMEEIRKCLKEAVEKS